MKYTPKQLGEWARRALAAKEQADSRWLQLILTLSQYTNTTPADCERRIRGLAKVR